MNELSFTNNEDKPLSIIIEPICYHQEIEKGETYLLITKEIILSIEYEIGQITVFQNHELGFALYKENINGNNLLIYDSLNAGRIG
jgi:hypothetical protein